MGARIGQAFSSTDFSVTATVQELIKTPDIERNGFCFTDGMQNFWTLALTHPALGVGTISPEFAEQVWTSLVKLRKQQSYFVPAAYQIRLGGSKGMLAIDYRLEGSVICVRKSMDKFDSSSLDVEISRAFDRPSKLCHPTGGAAHIYLIQGLCFLNRPLIMILDTANKVPITAFIDLQRRAVEETRASMRSFSHAARMLETHGLGASYKIPSLFTRLQKLGLELEHSGSLGMKTVLKNAETDILRDLKYHARIPIPESWKLVGIADEFDYLKTGEIYGSHSFLRLNILIKL